MPYNKPVGVSILTSGARLEKLVRCVDSLLAYCYYRPLVVAIFDNGSTDDTRAWRPPDAYGVEWRRERSNVDLGCAAGTNQALALVRDCQYGLHVESDFVHLAPEVSGHDRLWLRSAVQFMESGSCDYLYVRRMCDEHEMMAHWWSQWLSKTDCRYSPYLRCPGFWWSNNPAVRRVEALYESRTLPLVEALDGEKGTHGWSQPELKAPKPPNAWIHKWGVFVHDREVHDGQYGCGWHEAVGASTCQYGFFLDGASRFCTVCDHDDYRHMEAHERRYKSR